MDMQDQATEPAAAAIRLRTEHFDLVTRILGFDNDTSRGHLIGMHAVSVTRVRRGGPLGTAFIANSLVALGRYAAELAKFNLTARFDDLFEVVEEPAAAGAE